MQSYKEIVSKMDNISSVLLDNSVAYYIPEFQRTFVWGDEEINQLINDFNEDTEGFTVDTNELEGYLLGNIVLIDQGQKKIVVDGQQRLTTLSLFAKGISTVLNEHIADASAKNDLTKIQQWSKRVGEIEKGFNIVDDADEVQGLKIQHDPNLAFGSYFKKLIMGTNSPDDILKQEDSNIDIVYSKIYEFLKDLTDDKFQKFIQYYRNKVKLIVTSAPTEAKAFQLFEILNDRGRSLEPMDLIKNSFLKILSAERKSQVQIENFSNDWKEMMLNLQLTPKKKIASSTFLKQYIIAFRGENKKADQLFDYVKNPKNGFDGSSVLEFVKKMNKISKVYREIELKQYASFLDDHNMDILFDLLGIKQFHPILMIFSDATDDVKEKILDSVTRLGATILFSYTQTNYIEKELPPIIKEYWKIYENDEQAALNYMINSLEGKIKENVSVMKANLENRNFAGKNGEVHSKALMILKFLEIYFNQNTKVLSVPKNKKITVEHILSRNIDMSHLKYSDLGFNNEEDKKDNIHRLGNLTLLYNTDNASVGNGTYNDKKESYENSDFIMTKTLVTPLRTSVKKGKDTALYASINKYEKQYTGKKGLWTKSFIEKRSEDLAALMERIVLKNIIP